MHSIIYIIINVIYGTVSSAHIFYNNVSSRIAKPIKSFGSVRTAYIMRLGRIDLYYIIIIIIMWVRRVLKFQSLYDIRACVCAVLPTRGYYIIYGQKLSPLGVFIIMRVWREMYTQYTLQCE